MKKKSKKSGIQKDEIFYHLKRYLAILIAAILFGAAMTTLSYFELVDFQNFAGDVSAYKTTASGERVQLIKPNGGNSFRKGENVNFEWEYLKEKYNVMYVTDLWLVPVEAIPDTQEYLLKNEYIPVSLNNSGNEYLWKVGADIPEGRYHIMAIAKMGEEIKGYDFSDGTIGIKD